ncbi:unnamed protein product, partial [Amoebophrya sp. A25]|eukprot:GSA25T00019406001.1
MVNVPPPASSTLNKNPSASSSSSSSAKMPERNRNQQVAGSGRFQQKEKVVAASSTGTSRDALPAGRNLQLTRERILQRLNRVIDRVVPKTVRDWRMYNPQQHSRTTPLPSPSAAMLFGIQQPQSVMVQPPSRSVGPSPQYAPGQEQQHPHIIAAPSTRTSPTSSSGMMPPPHLPHGAGVSTVNSRSIAPSPGGVNSSASFLHYHQPVPGPSELLSLEEILLLIFAARE